MTEPAKQSKSGKQTIAKSYPHATQPTGQSANASASQLSIDILDEVSTTFCRYFHDILKIETRALESIFSHDLSLEDFTIQFDNFFKTLDKKSIKPIKLEKFRHAAKIYAALLENHHIFNRMDGVVEQYDKICHEQRAYTESVKDCEDPTVLQFHHNLTDAALNLLKTNLNPADVQATLSTLISETQSFEQYRQTLRREQVQFLESLQNNRGVYEDSLRNIDQIALAFNPRTIASTIEHAFNDVEYSLISRSWHSTVLREIYQLTHTQSAFTTDKNKLVCMNPGEHRFNVLSRVRMTKRQLEEIHENRLNENTRMQAPLFKTIDNALAKEHIAREFLSSPTLARILTLRDKALPLCELLIEKRNQPNLQNDNPELYRRLNQASKAIGAIRHLPTVRDSINKIFRAFNQLSSDDYAPPLDNLFCLNTLEKLASTLSNDIYNIQEVLLDADDPSRLATGFDINGNPEWLPEMSPHSNDNNTDTYANTNKTSSESNKAKPFGLKSIIQSIKNSLHELSKYSEKHPTLVAVSTISITIMLIGGATAVTPALALSHIVSASIVAHHLLYGASIFAASATSTSACLFVATHPSTTSRLISKIMPGGKRSQPQHNTAPSNKNDIAMEPLFDSIINNKTQNSSADNTENNRTHLDIGNSQPQNIANRSN